MRIRYYKYWLEQGRHKYRNSLVNFLSLFSQISDSAFRTQFQKDGDTLFLYRLPANIFLFVITRDDELIKAVSDNSLSHEDVAARLEQNERLGFASYVYMGDTHLGIASSMYGPKAKTYGIFMNQIFRALGINDVDFMMEPFEVSVPKESALQLHFKSAVHFKVSTGKPIFDELLGLFGNDHDADSIEVIIRPKAKGFMPNTAANVINAVADSADKLSIRAKNHLEESLMDYYIDGTGSLGDTINTTDEARIIESIENKVINNFKLTEAVREFNWDGDYEDRQIEAVARFRDRSAWPSGLLGD